MAKWDIPDSVDATFIRSEYEYDNTIRIFKLHDDAQLPTYGTDSAACFDLRAYLQPGTVVTFYDRKNSKKYADNINDKFTMHPGDRALIPTGLIFDLDLNQSLRLHPRSGIALKQGVTLANCEAVVDGDYTNETYIMLGNFSDQEFVVNHGDRICQGEIQFVRQNRFVETLTKPGQKGNRTGGAGSTGVA